VPRPLEFTSRITASASLQFVNMAVMLVWLPGRRRVSPSLRRLSPERRAGIYSSTPSTDNGTAKPETVHFQLTGGCLSSAPRQLYLQYIRVTALRRGRQRVPI
jgi:hypothetical protein